MKRTLASFAMMILSGVAVGEARAETLRAAGLTGYAPYSDEALPGKGFSNELIVEAMKRAGHTVEIVMLPWARALEGAVNGEFDILPSVWKTPEREKSLIYSDSYAINRVVFVKKAGDPFEFKTLGDLKGKKVGIVKEYGYGAEFLSNPDFSREETTGIGFNLKKIALGRIDLTLDDAYTLQSIINTQTPELRSELALTQGALSENPLYMTFSRKRPDAQKLADAFNGELARMRADGSYDRILDKYGMR